ncbi:MAG TPA: O-antigen ligase family protein, partial [Candidatus Moranbacteria bacterium]|nr:O-antigen ligase family protein [Candidatus Moranbacteria bacterium]
MHRLIKNQISPYWVFSIFIFFLFLPFNFALNLSATIDLPIARLAIIGIFGLYLLWGLKEKKIIVDCRLRFWLLLFFLTFSSLTYLWAPDPFRAGRKILFLWSFLPIYLMTFSLTQVQAWQEKLFKILSWSAFLAALFGLFFFFLQFIIGLDPTLNIIGKYLAPFFLGQNFSETVLAFPSWLVNIGGITLLRAFGSFPDPHLFALYLNLTLPLPLFLYLKNSQKKYLFLTGIILLASLLTFSRAAYLSLIVGLGSFLFFNNPIQLVKKKFLLVGLTLTGIVLFFIFPNPLTDRLFSSFNLTEGSNQGRLAMWQAG